MKNKNQEPCKHCRLPFQFTMAEAKREVGILVTEDSGMSTEPEKERETMEEHRRMESDEQGSKTKICRICGEEKPAADMVKKPAAKDGTDTKCKACKSLENRLYRAKRNKDAAVEMSKANERNGETVTERPPMIMIDFAGREDMYEALKALSQDEFRTPEMQAMKLIHDYVMENQSA